MNKHKLSRGEICVANLLPPVNSVQKCNFSLKNGHLVIKSQKNRQIFDTLYRQMNRVPYYHSKLEILFGRLM